MELCRNELVLVELPELVLLIAENAACAGA